MTTQLTPLVLDAETYYAADYTLKKTKKSDLSTSQYVRDDRFFCQLMALKYDDQKTEYIPHDRLNKELQGINWGSINLIAHHTQFDGFILSERYGITPAFYSDTLALSRAVLQGYLSGHDLDTIALYMGMEKGKELSLTKGIRIPNATQLETLGGYACNDVDITHAFYNKIKGFLPQKEHDIIDLTIRMFCQPELLLDRDRAMRALNAEIDKKRELLKRTGLEKEILSSNDKFAATLVEAGITPPMKDSPKVVGKKIYAFAKTDLDFIDLKANQNERVRDLVEARLAIKSTITETRIKRIVNITDLGTTFPAYYAYWKAHTSRFAGGDKTNPQNFTRKSELRKSIVAPDGKVLVVGDSSQIEARVNAGVSKQEDLLEAFRQGRDVYSEMASRIYARNVHRKRKPDHKDFNPEDEMAGFVGKVAILGLGYYMGAKTFRHTLACGSMGPPVDFSLPKCYNIVNIYRSTNAMIKANWDYLGNVLYSMMQKNCDIQYQYGVRFTFETVHLPNGTRIWYPGLHVDENGDIRYRENGVWKKIYSGLLAENVVQALARIVVADQMLVISKEYKIVLITHDEIVASVDENKADEAYKFMMEVMSTPPLWAPKLPVAAEGGYAKEYSK